MTDRDKLLGRVRMYDFALVEAIEYLDTHPQNTAALAYYSEMRTAFDDAAAAYENAFGPLTAREVDTRTGHWRWIDDPWPWEGEDD
ncbi:MAG: spore coat protein CotJB [Eubacteriales bacterium]|nr:spore coat protein CotJB [Eubacteriales bacterium]